MGAELGHEVTQKGRHRVVDNLSIGGKDLWGVSDVCLWCGHLARIAEAEYAAQALLAYRRTDRAMDAPMTAAGM
jgi:hypothetical protein